MIIVSQNKRCAVEVQNLRLMEDVRPVANSSMLMMGYDIWVNESIRVAKYKNEDQAQREFNNILHKWANGEVNWYYMPEDGQS